MLLVETTPQVGQLYGFMYSSQDKNKMSSYFSRGKVDVESKRLVLVQRVDSDGFFGHDFLADGPRQFKFSKIKTAKDFTRELQVYDYDDLEDANASLEYFTDKGCLVYDDEGEDLVYVVNYKS